MTKQTTVPGTPRPSSREDLEKRRKGVLATGPSGAVYRIRKVNLRRQLELGNLPTELRRLALSAMKHANGGDPMAAALAEMTEEDMEAIFQRRSEQRDEDDRLIIATVIEPALTPGDLGSGELDDDPVVPVIDQDWLLAVARGTIVIDAEGQLLWGPNPQKTLDVYQEHHACPADCEHCAAVDKWYQQQFRRYG